MIGRIKSLGFDEHATILIKNYLRERTQRVVLNEIEPDWINLQRGVPQDTILRPLLVKIFVNDLEIL